MNVFPYRYRVLIFLCALTTLTYLDRICISIVGVRIKTELSLSNEQFGWVLAAFAFAYALFEIPSGILGDKIGPRKVFIRIVLWWSFFTAVTGLATGLISLIVIRFLFGMGEAGTYPNCLITVSRWYPANETGRALTWVGIGSQVGSAIAPLIIIPLAEVYGWRMPFYVNAGLGIIWVIWCYYWFKDYPAYMRNITSAEKDLIENNCRHKKEQHHVSLKFILKNKTVWAVMFMYFCFQWSNYFFVAWMPVYLQEGLHFTEKQTSPIIFSLFIAGIIGLLSGGFFGDWIVKKKGLKRGRRFMGLTGMGMCGTMILLAAFLKQNHLSSYCLIAANFSYSFAVMTSYAVCADIGRNNAGTVTGAMNFFGQMGAFFLALTFGKIADITHSYSFPLFIVAFVTLAGCMLWFIIDPTKQVHDTNDSKISFSV